MYSGGVTERHWINVGIHCLLDFLLFCGAFMIAMRIRFGAEEWLSAPVMLWPGMVIGAGVFGCIIYIVGFYSPLTVRSSRFKQALTLLLCQALALGIMIAVFYVNFSARIGRGVMSIGAPVAYLFAVLHHLVLRSWQRGRRERVALIVASPFDEEEAELFEQLSDHFLDVIGLVRHNGYEPRRKDRVLGPTADLPLICQQEHLDRILCTNQTIADRDLYGQFCHVRYCGIRVMPLIALCEELFQCVPVELITPEWLMVASSAPQMLYITKMKRAFDVVTSVVGMLCLWPFLVLGIVAVKLGSRGPVFYRQRRCGRFGRAFEVVKLRTMRVDAEEHGAVWAQEADPRTTRVGGILRKYRIDEIPQLWNVLRGDMSFVGPRPERPEFIEELAEKIPFYRERLLVQPGITGWAQVSYPYGSSVEDARRKLEYDLYYMKHMSLFLDVFVLLDTIRIILYGGLGEVHKRRLADYSKALTRTREISRASLGRVPPLEEQGVQS